ncbi:hypothetical protein OAF50_02405, partial [bacterium]|nr:hypothetical protein [bacterium]
LLSFGIKAKQDKRCPWIQSQFALLSFGIKAKLSRMTAQKSAEFALLSFGIKAKPLKRIMYCLTQLEYWPVIRQTYANG